MNSDQRPGCRQESIGKDAPQLAAKVENGPDMTAKAGVLTGPVASSSSAWRQKRVLLVDSNRRSRESRAKVMRTLGVEVDCVGSANAARVQLAAAAKYNLILVDLGRDVEGAESLVREIRAQNARQLVQFLVGSPLFVATSLTGGNSRPRRGSAPVTPVPDEKPSPPAVSAIDFGQRVRDAEAAEIVNKSGAQ